MDSATDSRGFRAGRARELVIEAFDRHAQQYASRASPSVKSVAADESSRSPLATWNGGTTDTFRWTQTLSDVTVELVLPYTVKTKKDLTVVITSSSLRVAIAEVTLLSGILSEKIDASDSTWMLEEGRVLTLVLVKAKETWWTRVLTTDPEIDGSRIESKKRIEEYDEETQGAIRKIMFDEEQKRRGLLTSDQQVMAKQLEAAWNADGSPFKGTPFDSSIVRH